LDALQFWALIKDANQASRGDVEAEVDLLLPKLASLPPGDILDFQRLLDEQMAESYTWDLWAAAYIINGGCSDDCFEYFRGWLIAQGELVFQAALRDPESLADVADPEVECERMLYVAQGAFERATGRGLPRRPSLQAAEPSGRRWKESQVGARLPGLAVRFSDYHTG